MGLQKEFFNKVYSGEKTIELRLYDEKRKKLKIGDIISIHASDAPTMTFEKKIMGLVKAKDFKALFDIIMPEQCGFDSFENAIKTMQEFYPLKEQHDFGVVGIILG